MYRNTLVVLSMFFVLLLFNLPAKADTFATTPNKGGGLIVLTTIKCSARNGLVAYSTHPQSSTQWGCWFYDENFVHVTYNDGDTRSYPKTVWTFPNVKPKADM